MKKYIHKILAGIIAVAMVFGNFAGMGAPVVKAYTEEPEINIRVVDGSGKAVSGVYLVLKHASSGKVIPFEEATDASGEVTACDELLDIKEEATYYIQTKDEDKEHTCVKPIEVHFCMSKSGWGNIPYIDTLNGETYDGDYVELTITGSGSSKPVNPEISSVKASIAEANRNGSNATITVTGTALPSKLYCQIWYVMQNNGINKAGIVQTVTANGTDTERKFNVQLPPASEYPKAVAWRLSVSATSNGYVKETGNISIAKDAATGETEALKAAIKGAEALKEADYTVKSWKAYHAAVEAAKPLQEDINATNAKCWSALQAIEKAKSALVLVKDLATAGTKAALNSAIAEAAGLREADYTAGSWKAYSAAIASAKLLLAEEDATEVQCQAALNEIRRTKAVLTSASVKVSKITISGISSSIAVGKKIKLTAKVSPANAANKAVKWKTSNKKYATVDSKGNVTTKKAGAGKKVTITATAADGSGRKAAYKIKIMKNAVKSISLKAAKSVKAGKSIKIKADVKTTGKNANKTLKWTSSNTKYATVSAKGVVKAKNAGKGKKVKITAAATDGSNKKKTVTIKIK